MTIIVTDHAVIRYLERIEGVDIEAIRDYLSSDNVLFAIAMSKGRAESAVIHPDGFRLVINAGKVVTCTGEYQRGMAANYAKLPKRKKRRDRRKA